MKSKMNMTFLFPTTLLINESINWSSPQFMLYLHQFGEKMRNIVRLLCLIVFSQIERCFLQTETHINNDVTNITARTGGKVTLPCVFDTKLNCRWFNNTYPINYSTRGIHLRNNKTTNCSITIPKVSQSDFATWNCCSISEPQQVCSVVQLTQEIVLPNTTVIEMGNRRIEQIDFGEHVPTNISCVSKYGNPAPRLYWELNGHRINGQMDHWAHENVHATTLRWNTSLDCEHIKQYPNSSTLKCCVESPGQDQGTCDTVVILQTTDYRPFIMLNGHNVSHGQIKFSTDAHSLENLTCAISSRAFCQCPKMTFNFIWIHDGHPYQGSIKNLDNSTKIIAFNTSIALIQFSNQELECRVTYSFNNNYSTSTSVRLQWNENTGNNATFQNVVVITVSAVLFIIITGLIIYFCMKRADKTNRTTTASKNVIRTRDDEHIFEDVSKRKSYIQYPTSNPLQNDKGEMLYESLELSEERRAEIKEAHKDKEYAEIILTK